MCTCVLNENLSLALQAARKRSQSYTLGPKMYIVYMLGARGNLGLPSFNSLSGLLNSQILCACPHGPGDKLLKGKSKGMSALQGRAIPTVVHDWLPETETLPLPTGPRRNSMRTV